MPLNIIKPQNAVLCRRKFCPCPLSWSAADLVATKEQFKPVIESLLGRIHIVSDLDAALKAARLLRYQERLVTLDGDIIFPAVPCGGKEKKQTGVLSRRKEATLLREEMQKNCRR